LFVGCDEHLERESLIAADHAVRNGIADRTLKTTVDEQVGDRLGNYMCADFCGMVV